VHIAAADAAGDRVRDHLLAHLLLHVADRVRHLLHVALPHGPADGVGHLLDDGVRHLLADGVGHLLVNAFLDVGRARHLLANAAPGHPPPGAGLRGPLAAHLAAAALLDVRPAGARVEAALVRLALVVHAALAGHLVLLGAPLAALPVHGLARGHRLAA